MEIVLVTFILAFVARAVPNVDALPSIPWAEQPNADFGNTDDKDWGRYTRMKFLETHPPESNTTLKPVRPEKFWLQRPIGSLA
jgi:hypothetical protein